LVGDNGHQVVRRIDSAGNISTFAKGGLPALIDGNPQQVFLSPETLRPDGLGNVYITDGWNVYRINSQGPVILIAGLPRVCGFSGDGGPATLAELCQPWDVARDDEGNLFIADSNNNRIRRVDARTGIITTVAGSGPPNGLEHYAQGGFAGDGGPATEARLNTPYGVAIDRTGNLFIADSGNGRVRRVDTRGIITTFATTNAAKLIFDSAGNLYVAGDGVRRIDPTGAVTPLTGTGVIGFSGDGGPASQATFDNTSQANGMAIDAEGNLYLVDPGNFRVRAIRRAASPGTTTPNYTGLWWNPAESGWGINLTHQGTIIFATLFTYDARGDPMWLVMSNGASQPDGRTFSGDLYQTTGPPFNANPFTPIGASNISKVGEMTLSFSSASSGTLVYSVNGTQVSKIIQPQIYGSHAALCQPTRASLQPTTNYQALWWNAAESGWGVNLTHQDNILFATLFAYDASGKGMWLVMSNGSRQTDGSYLGDLYKTTGPAFNAVPFNPIGPANLTKTGTMQLRFKDGETGALAYSVNGVNVTKAISRQVFSSPMTGCSTY
jgi:hypothetical protein